MEDRIRVTVKTFRKAPWIPKHFLNHMVSVSFSVLLIIMLLSLLACSPSNKSDVASADVSSETLPESGSFEPSLGDEQSEEEYATTQIGPYDYSRIVNSDLIFKGEILSVEQIPEHIEYLNFGEPKSDDIVQSLMKVRVDKVYWGKVPGDKKEVVIYCPTSDKDVIGAALTLSADKEYVFFSRDWTDEEMLESMAYFGLDKYDFSKRSDMFIRHPADNLAIAKDGYIITDRAWSEVVTSSKPFPEEEPSFEVEEGGKVIIKSPASDSFHAEWLKLTEGYAVHDPEGIGQFNSIYTEEDFVQALAKLQELYPEK